jgi:SAM-dependent methyltransferase
VNKNIFLMKNFWNERYSTKEYIYGTKPNQFFKDQVDKLKPGKLLLVGEGEGRNAVFAAKLGWQVDAVDSSSVAKEKALKLAGRNKATINYQTANILTYTFPHNTFDAIGIIFLHINESREESQILYQKFYDSLKTNGRIILELFSQNQLGKKSGGPQDLSMLSSTEQIRKHFQLLKHEILKEENIILSEGESHNGEASVIRFVGVK